MTKTIDTDFAAGTDTATIMTALGTAVDGVPENAQISNLGDDGALNPARSTTIRTYHDENGNKKAAALIQVPSVDEFLADETGVTMLSKFLNAATMRKVSAALSRFVADNCAGVIDLPKTVADYAVTARAGGSGQKRFSRIIWKEFAKEIVKYLNENSAGLGLTVDKLETVLSNSAMAETLYPSIDDSVWTGKIIPLLQSKAPFEREYTDPRSGEKRTTTDSGDLFAHWVATRDANKINEAEIDLGSLDLGEL